MKDIFRAYARSIKSLTERGVLWHLVWPSLIAVVLWLVLAVVSRDILIVKLRVDICIRLFTPC